MPSVIAGNNITNVSGGKFCDAGAGAAAGAGAGAFSHSDLALITHTLRAKTTQLEGLSGTPLGQSRGVPNTDSRQSLCTLPGQRWPEPRF